uniref:hypothetical protein n=1 Tax=Saccharibacillus qingshengii TaxID=1763540 RepID=UPI001554AFCB
MIALSDFDRRRLIAVVIICMIVVNLLVPIRQAHAVVPILAAPEIALGTFVGVVAIGAVGMEVFGYTQQSDQAMAYASATWAWGQDTMKKAVVDSYNAAVAAGDKVMTLSAEVVDYWSNAFASMLIFEEPTVNVAGGYRYGRTSTESVNLMPPVDSYLIMPGGYAGTVVVRTGPIKDYYIAGISHAVSSDFLGSHSHGVSYNFYNRTN